jgi:uncharacterized membrane-anchored protein YhcB (DUF1043 family)
MNSLSWILIGLGSVIGVCITFVLVYRLGHSFFKRLDHEDRGLYMANCHLSSD